MLGLLSLIPCLIKQLVAGWWVVVGVAGWNTSAACPLLSRGLAHCWVLRRHLLWQGFLGAASGLGRLTHSVVGVVVCRCGFGVWLCVECCIVDASILLWSSV